jgi:precorrin-8X/cobalt-precorrin-8 methylmutase
MTFDRPRPVDATPQEVLRSRVDLSPMPPLWRAVVERVIEVSADLEYVVDLVTDEAQLRQGLSALRAGAPIVTDDPMVSAGIPRHTVCQTAEPAAARLAHAAGISTAAAGMRLAYAEVGSGAVWVVGRAGSAVREIMKLEVGPALVIGLPAGLVDAAGAKAELRASGLPQVSNVSEKGGADVAVAALDALLRFGEGR